MEYNEFVTSSRESEERACEALKEAAALAVENDELFRVLVIAQQYIYQAQINRIYEAREAQA